MRPILCKIGPVPIFSYGLLIAAGFLVSVHLMRRDAKKAGIDPDRFTDGAFWVLFLGLAGTRLLHIILYYQQYSWTDPLEWIAIWKGGLVFQGAIPPAILFCIYYIRKHHLNFWQCADIACPYIPLGHAFGRLGCFMNGCCYGHVTDLPWGIPFPRVPSDLSLPATGSPVYLDHFGSHSVPHDALL